MNWIHGSFLALGVTVWMGCASTPTKPVEAEEKGIVHVSENFSLLILDPALANQLRMTRSAYFLDAGIGARFRNIGTTTLALRARTLFKNEAGVTLGDSGYKDLLLAPGQDWAYYAKAANPEGTRALLCLTSPTGPLPAPAQTNGSVPAFRL
jgi:hypothetical protein